ncbi:hypothetical protein JTB14_035853 [Gonioctena quinquepunctata]|nr:hypothetical protein JTB14_035853 [Gonioctena quinquepunctata]
MSDAGEPFPLFEENSEEPEAYDLLYDIQCRQNNLNERIISLKATTETLKNQILSEKGLWTEELKETVKLEKQLKEKHDSMNKLTAFEEDEFKRKLEVFKDFLFFSQTSQNLKKIIRENSYQQWLADLNSECNLELDKIGQSLTALQPLKKIASEWNIHSEADSGISENKDSDGANQEAEIPERDYNYV